MQRSEGLHLPTVGQLIISMGGVVIYGLGFILMVLLGSFILIGGGSFQQAASIIAMAWTAAGAALLNLPSVVHAILRLMGRPVQKSFKAGQPFVLVLALLVLLLSLGVGSALAASQGIALFFVSALHLLVVGIPLWLLVWVASRHLNTGSLQRLWGILSIGLTLTPVLTIMLELILVAGIVALVVFGSLKSMPDLMDVFNRIQLRLSYSAFNQDVSWRIIQNYVNQPVVFYTALAIFSGLIPIIEELLKPLAIWFLINHRLTPSEGFVAGLISGAAFSFFESMNAMGSAMNESWAVLAAGRMGAGLLHIVTTAFMGWGLASAFSEGKYWHLVKAFILAMTLHALWNGLTLMSVVGAMLRDYPFGQSLGMISPFGLLILMVVMLQILLRSSQMLARQPMHG